MQIFGILLFVCQLVSLVSDCSVEYEISVRENEHSPSEGFVDLATDRYDM